MNLLLVSTSRVALDDVRVEEEPRWIHAHERHVHLRAWRVLLEHELARALGPRRLQAPTRSRMRP